MEDVRVGARSEFADGARVICSIDGRDVVVLEHRGKYYAFENVCPHMGGPVGEGMVIGRVEAVVAPGTYIVSERFSDTDTNIVCPWHGWEYDIDTGRAVALPSVHLNVFDVVVRDEDVYVRTHAGGEDG